MFLLTIALLLTMIYSLYKVKFSKRDAAWATFPKPKSVWLLHNSLDLIGMNSSAIMKLIMQWHDDLGDVFLMVQSPFDCGTVFVSDPDVAEAISFHQQDRSRSSAYEFLTKWIGHDSIFSGTASRSKQKIKLALMDLKPDCYRRFFKIMHEQIDDFMEASINSKKPIDMYEEANKFAIDLVFKAQYDTDLNSQSGLHHEFVEALEQITDIGLEIYLSPLPQSSFLFPFTKLYAKGEKTLKVLNDFTLKVVQERRKIMKSPGDQGFGFIDRFLQSEVDGELMTDDEVSKEVNSSILGNHDTMKVSMTFLIYKLAENQVVQERVYEELKGLKMNHCDITEEDLDRLPYLEAVIRETLRLFPPIPFFGRKLRTEKTVGRFTFPKDVEVIISVFMMMRNPKYFKDPLTFNPDRFLAFDTLPREFCAFSIGTRKCVGVKYAMMLLKLLAAKFLMNHRLKLAEGQKEVTIGVEMVLKPKEKIFICFEKRD